jgi:hypothetical protein
MLYGRTVTDGIYQFALWDGMGWCLGICSAFASWAPRRVFCARLGAFLSTSNDDTHGSVSCLIMADGRHVFEIVIQLIEIRITSKIVQHVTNLRCGLLHWCRFGKRVFVNVC